MKSRNFRNTCIALAFFALGTQPALAVSDFSFAGSFTQDTDVQLIHIHTDADITNLGGFVLAQTFSVNGGTNAQSSTIVGGGFNTYMALFDQSTGAQVGNDTSSTSGTGDAILTIVGTLSAGDYLLALTQYDNVIVGTTLAEGFANDIGLYTPPGTLFNGLDGHWALDILNVASASLFPASVPEPTSLALVGIAGFIPFARRKPAAA